MSTVAKRYLPEMEDGRTPYENKKPASFDLYFKDVADLPNPHQESPDQQAAQDFKIPSTLNEYFPEEKSLGEHALRKGVGPGVNFLANAITSIPGFIQSAQKLGTMGINKLFQQFGMGFSPEELEEVQKMLHTAKGSQLPSGEDIYSKINELSGNRLEPTTSTERTLHGGAGIAGNIVGFPGGAGAVSTPLKAAGTAALAGTTAGLEESGVNPWLALGGGILADIATRTLGKSAKKVLGLATNFTPEAGKLASESLRIKPEQVKKGIIEAGERLGIPVGEIPLSAQVDNRTAQFIESKLRESSLSGKSLQNQLENVESKVKNTYEQIANNVSKRQNGLPGAISAEAVSQLKNIEQKAEEGYRNYYNQAEKSLPSDAKIASKNGTAIMKIVDDTVKKLSGGLGSPSKDPIVTRLTRLKNDWSARFPTGEIPVRDLQELKKDLNQVIKYEVKGGVDKTLEPLAHASRNAIQEYGKSNAPYLFRFNEAERQFANTAKNFRKNDTVRSLLDTQNPEKIINSMKKPKQYQEFKDLFDRTPEGKEAFQELSRYLLEDIIGSKLLTKEGNISWGKTSGLLNKPGNREIIQEIVGKDNFKKLQDINKFSQGIEDGLRKFANTSRTATNAMDIGLILGTVGKGLANILSGNVASAGKYASLLFTPYLASKLITNPNFIEAFIEASQAAKGSDPNKFFEAATRAASFVIPEVSQDPSLD